jgi:hypothetical protein
MICNSKHFGHIYYKVPLSLPLNVQFSHSPSGHPYKAVGCNANNFLNCLGTEDIKNCKKGVLHIQDVYCTNKEEVVA